MKIAISFQLREKYEMILIAYRRERGTHPFKPFEGKLTYELCYRYDPINHPWIRVIQPGPAKEEVNFSIDKTTRFIKSNIFPILDAK
ncbi:MAG: hypothetical protein J7L53_10890 [Deltaproteobacteria bacterium]|nr:hypothetical protein [Deltaproteobacteria bacterium]